MLSQNPFRRLRAWPAAVVVTATVASATIVSALDYEKDVMPIFEEKCFDCHSASAEKVKGGLRLDDPEHFHKRFGKNDAVIPGNWDASYLFVTVSRPHDDKDAMPPTDKGTPLTREEVLTVANWIYEGAEINGEKGDKGDPDDVPAKYLEAGKPILEQAGASGPDKPALRSWTNRDGKVINATYLRVEGGDVLLLMANGKVYRYPIAKLSDDDQAQVKQLTAGE